MAVGQTSVKNTAALSLERFRGVRPCGMPMPRRLALASELRNTIAPAMRQRLTAQRTMQTDLHVHASERHPSSQIFETASQTDVGTLVLTNHNQVRNVFSDWRHAANNGVDDNFGSVMLTFRLRERFGIQTKVYYNPFDKKIADLVASHRQHASEIMPAEAIERTLQGFSERGCWIVWAYPGRHLSQGIDPRSFSDATKELSRRGILHGLETSHSGHTLLQKHYLTRVAKDSGLWEDGGSDFPGFHVGDYTLFGNGTCWKADVPYFVVEEVRRYLAAPILAKADDLARRGQTNNAFHKLWQALMINPYDFSAYKRTARILENAA